MSLNPFLDKEEVEKIKKERDELLEIISKYNLPDSELRFILKKIENITQKLLEKAKYSKK
jgi:hypothetical protein